MENQVVPNIFWVGVHFPAPPGAMLNSYLIIDEKIAVVDTTAPATANTVVEKVKSLIDPKQIDYIVLTHGDLDHAGGVAALLQDAPQATIFASEFEARSLPLWGVKAPVKITKEGDTLALGQHTLRFIQSPFICTPGHQLIYEETEGILFSGDLMAQIGPAGEWKLFAEGDRSEILQKVQAMKLGCTDYPKQALAKIKDLPIKIVASGHGQLLKNNIDRYIEVLSS